MAFNKVDYEATKNIPIPLGVGQTWQNMTASRAVNTTYTNTTGQPIYISVVFVIGSVQGVDLLIDGIAVARTHQSATTINQTTTTAAIIPAGSTYSMTRIAGVPNFAIWWELR